MLFTSHGTPAEWIISQLSNASIDSIGSLISKVCRDKYPKNVSAFGYRWKYL